MMNILFISTSDFHGGAAIAASRLLYALKSEGKKVKMVVRDKLGSDNDVFVAGGSHKNRFNFYFERTVIFLKNRFSRKNLFDISIANSGVQITKLEEYKRADIIHLHWINQGMLSLSELENILKSGKKVVWTMHDMWPFTGICHHAGICNNFEKGCGFCPYLKNPSSVDLSHQTFKKKSDIYSKGKITFVACSEWLADLAVKSPIAAGHTVISIPNPIDTDVYYPVENKDELREKWRLPTDKKIILYAAAKASDPRKGTEYLIKVAKKLATERCEDIIFLIVGNEGKQIADKLTLPTVNMGYITPQQMPEIYNVSDLYVTPSLQENLPNTIMESMACGTPCVGFNIGGIPEMIIHKENGYVSRYKDVTDFAEGILWSLFETDTATLSLNAHKRSTAEYNNQNIAERYIKIYEAY